MDFCSIASDPFIINIDIWSYWLDGEKAEEASRLLLGRGGIPERCDLDSLKTFVEYQYRNFELIESIFQQGYTENYDLFLSMTDEQRNFLSCSYYELNLNVARYLIGKKLSSKLKKRLKTVSSKASVSDEKCKRGFDNLKRLSKVMETQQPSNHLEYISKRYFLDLELSRGYKATIFMCFHKIDLSHKSLNYLSFSDLLHISTIIMENVLIPNFVNCDDYSSLLPKCCNGVRKMFLNNNTLMKRLEFNTNECILSNEAIKPINQNVLSLSKLQYLLNIISTASCLSSAKHVRNLVIKIHEKAVEPFIAKNFSPLESSSIFEALIQTVKLIIIQDFNKNDSNNAFFNYLSAIREIVVKCIKTYRGV